MQYYETFTVKCLYILVRNIPRVVKEFYELKASKSGEDYICLVGASSDSITIKKGEIY